MKTLHKKLARHFPQARSWWPMSRFGKWEVCAGAILTQNTNWNNVEKALDNLAAAGLVDAESTAHVSSIKLERIIKPAGFYTQKAERLKALAKFFVMNKNPMREDLLAIKGIGPETADSIMLYACDKLFMPVDAYTRRILSRLGIISGTESYENIRALIEKSLPKNARVYKELHAGFVELAKKHCMKKPACEGCPLAKDCKEYIASDIN